MPRLLLSSAQYTLLRKLPAEFDADLARRYKQTTFGSFGRRGYVRQSGSKFYKTNAAEEVLAEYQKAEIFRRNPNGELSHFFRKLFRVG